MFDVLCCRRAGWPIWLGELGAMTPILTVNLDNVSIFTSFDAAAAASVGDLPPAAV